MTEGASSRPGSADAPTASPVRLRDAVVAATVELAAAGVPSPEPDAVALACHLLGVSRGQLWRNLDDPVPLDYADLVRRRAGRVPLQHLTGVAHFRHLTLAVGPGVFVPRPETEVLVDVALGLLTQPAPTASSPAEPLVVDLGAGSGAIAASIAHERPGCRVHAVELDPAALRWLRRNVAGTGVAVHEGDLRAPDRLLPGWEGVVDLVTANPPYIPSGSVPRDPEVSEHDPAVALYSGPDGLDHIRLVEQVAARLLRPLGWVVVEHADAQGESAPAVFSDRHRWQQVTDHRDLAGRPRLVVAQRTGG